MPVNRVLHLSAPEEAAVLERLRAALWELQAAVIAVPPLSLEQLRRGHAVHFRCRHPEAAGLRVDVMSKLRGVADPGSAAAKPIVEYTWGKIWNAKAYNACSNMPRSGHMGNLTEQQVRDVMALLLDPQSPVNQ